MESDTDQNPVPKPTSDLWIKKHVPQTVEAHVMNKKKKEEFVHTCLDDPMAKILIMQGPSGSGKNALIDCFARQYNFEVERYSDTKSVKLFDVMGDVEFLDGTEKYYPDDLENFI